VNKTLPLPLVAIDGGKRHVGLGVFDGYGKLAHVARPNVTGFEHPMLGPMVARRVWGEVREFNPRSVVVEWPSVWTQGGGRGNPNDLLDITHTLGAVVMHLFSHGVEYAERVTTDWKGQTPKPKNKKTVYIVERRVRKRLSPEELRVFGSKPSYDETDGVGVGLWRLRRL
jgi:hypothetical protein